MMAREGMTGRVPDKLLLFRMGSGLSVLLVEDTENTGSGLVVYDGLAVLADNVDAKFLTGYGCFIQLQMTSGSREDDLRRCRRT